MVCRKIIQSRSSHYVFSLKSDDLWLTREKRSKLYLGKLRAVSNTEYVLYDNGICAAPEDPDSLLEALEANDDYGGNNAARNTPLQRKMDRDSKAAASTATMEDVSLYRRELVVIKYNTKHRPAPDGTRGMEVCIPNVLATSPTSGAAVSASAAAAAKKDDSTPANLVKPFERIRLAGKQNVLFEKTCFIMHEKHSRYDPLSSCLVDFKGRAHVASVKNFQLVQSNPMTSFSSGPKMQEHMLNYDAEQEFLIALFCFHLSMFCDLFLRLDCRPQKIVSIWITKLLFPCCKPSLIFCG